MNSFLKFNFCSTDLKRNSWSLSLCCIFYSCGGPLNEMDIVLRNKLCSLRIQRDEIFVEDHLNHHLWKIQVHNHAMMFTLSAWIKGSTRAMFSSVVGENSFVLQIHTFPCERSTQYKYLPFPYNLFTIHSNKFTANFSRILFSVF